jgi:AraC-like DNA-binding protein
MAEMPTQAGVTMSTMDRSGDRRGVRASGADGATQVTRSADVRIRHHLARDYVGFSEADVSGCWRMPPTATVTVIVNLAETFGALPRAFVAGLEDEPAVVERGGVILCLDLKLSPLGAYTLLARPLDELTGHRVDLGEIFAAAGRRWVEAIAEAATWDERFALVDTFLLDRAAKGPQPAAGVVWAWRRLVATGGRIPIGRLAEEIGWSRRHLVTQCKRQLGLPPKTLARIVRFNGLLRQLRMTGQADWARLAAEAGYFDQAHLIRDFRQFTGTTPTGFLRQGATAEVTSFQAPR